MPAYCDSPGCVNPLPDNGIKRGAYGYAFCSECKRKHSYRVLITQVQHGASIKNVILDAASFKTAGGMADYVGVSFVTMYHWIKKYFKCSFQEFRRKYICKRRGEQCYLLDIERSSYSRHDYVLKKIRSKRYCACINALDDNLIMTSAPIPVVQGILRGSPKIAQLSDGKFALVPSPIYFGDMRMPIYFDLKPKAFPRPNRDSDEPNPYLDALLDAIFDILPKSMLKRRKSSKIRRLRKPVKRAVLCGKTNFSFRDRVFVTLHKLGNSVDVVKLVEHLRTEDGRVPRTNNTRREVYRNPGLLEFDPGDNQIMRLTPDGVQEAKSIMGDLPGS